MIPPIFCVYQPMAYSFRRRPYGRSKSFVLYKVGNNKSIHAYSVLSGAPLYGPLTVGKVGQSWRRAENAM